MRLVDVIEGELELRWTWLPYWLGANLKFREELEREIRDVVLLNGITNSDEDLDRLHIFVCDRIQARYQAFRGLGEFLQALRHTSLPQAPS